ncbi:hypothetical protein SDC9_88310 [bioreactor metagenome]|uniref:Uncharacterized protein n=1 Tax=bioreactor metagenome TaxID=1076179 RepID=A0A644ZVP5_9ZZZZ
MIAGCAATGVAGGVSCHLLDPPGVAGLAFLKAMRNATEIKPPVGPWTNSTEVPRMVRHIDRQRLQTIGQQIDDSFR